MFRFRPSRLLGTILVLLIGCLATLGSRPWGAAGNQADKTLAPYGYGASLESGGGLPQVGTGAAGPAVTVQAKEVQSGGALPAAAVRQVLVAETARLARSCQDAVHSGYQLPAEITLVFTVGTDGQVTGEPVGKPPLANQGFESCLAQALKGLQFPQVRQAPARVTVKLALAIK